MNESAHEVYAALVHLSTPTSPAAARELTSLGEEEFGAALAQLRALHLLDEHDGAVATRPPTVALLSLLTDHRDALSLMLGTLPELDKHYRHGIDDPDRATLVERIPDRDGSVRALNQLISTATSSIKVFEKPPFGGSNEVEASEAASLNRGISTQVLYESTVLSLPNHMANLEAMTALGEEFKVRDRLPFKMLLVDGVEAIIPLAGAQVRSAIRVRSSVLTDALDELFRALWDVSVPALAPDGSAESLTADERELLRLLATGIKDVAIARQLGVSPRTVSRRVTALLERMGCTNRLQAGITAAQRGWF